MTPARKPIVVCVDDEPPILAALRRLLRREPYELLTTERAEEALGWLQDRPVDVLITDQRMPGMSGSELLEEAIRVAPKTVRVILTGYADSSLNLMSMDRPFHKMIIKPWEDEDLKRLILELIRDREQLVRSGPEIPTLK